MSTKSGRFIVIEGGGGSGKSTLTQLLRETYAAEKIVYTREPGGTVFAEEVRKLLFMPETKQVSINAIIPLVTAARIDHVERTIAPAIARGQHVVSDRFDSSTYAYQIFGGERSDLKDWFWELRKRYATVLPETYIFLDIAPEKAIARARARNASGVKAQNYFDEKETAYHARVYAGYREFLEHVPHAIVNADQPLEEVKADFLSVIRPILGS